MEDSLKDRKRTFWRREMQDVSVLPEHVNLFNARDRLHVQLLERALELLVILGCRRFALWHDLPARCPLSACSTLRDTFP